MRNKHLIPMLFLAALNVFSAKAQWTSLGNAVSSPNQRIWGFSVASPEIIWALSWNYMVPYPDEHLVKTNDGGLTWAVLPIDIAPGYYSFQLAVLDETNAWLAAATKAAPHSGAVYHTTDGGLSWVEQSTAFVDSEAPFFIHFWDAEDGLAFGTKRCPSCSDNIVIYTTHDGGVKWTKAGGAEMPAQLEGEGLIFFSGNGYYQVMGDNIWFPTSKNRVFRSTDRGLSWEASGDIMVGPGRAASIAFKDELNGIVIAAFPNGAARTNDGGMSWTPVNIPSIIWSAEIDYIPGTEASYIVHNGAAWWTEMDNSIMLFTHDAGETWDYFTSNVKLDCFEFLSPTLGFGGGGVNGYSSGGMYRWRWDIFTALREPLAGQCALSPNPAAHFLKVDLPEASSHAFVFQVFDAQGKMALQQMIQNGEQIEVRSLPPGMYWAKAVADGVVYTGKFVKR
ncbi:MAG: T9SS type A sorting domain-containing protein [Lewinellaceae bacterium]|nr:T9SS type A sorting domain-containing protein [Lewinellaceae bacterium]